MVSRRSALASVAAFVGATFVPAKASEFHPYDDTTVEKAVASGRPVVVHIYAPWCLQCHIQASYLDGLKDDPAFTAVTFFRVDYDNQKDVVAKLNCPRSTVIAYRGGKEVARMSWSITKDAVINVLKAAI